MTSHVVIHDASTADYLVVSMYLHIYLLLIMSCYRFPKLTVLIMRYDVFVLQIIMCTFYVRASDLKSGDPEFRSRSDHKLDLFLVLPGSTPWLRLYIANWSASCQLGFFTC